ncbi:activating transcription factor 4b [Esox lucius]|uniref:Cyclic AMP-dependent transcription factor ATF-4 n=1 Tax=Esox lucius TaxID=8010 RepID=A0AAY5KRX7_ESOLU|nr:activating transcription factor 4b [Esox lucius]
MTMMSSQFGLEDMEALLWGPSSLMADPMAPLLHQNEVTSIEGGASPLSSSSSSSPLPLLSPPSSPPGLLLQEAKAEADFPWLAADELGPTCHIGDDGKEDAFSGMDWMAERVDLSGFDLDSLMGSCSTDGSPGSPEDIMDSLECPMELDSLPLPTPIDFPTPADPLLPIPGSSSQHGPPDEACSPPPCVPDPQEELEIKSEPQSPAPSPPHTFSLDLGSEVDVSEGVVENPLGLGVPQPVPKILLSLSPTRILLVLAPKKEIGLTTTANASFPDVLSSNSDCNTHTSTTSTRLQLPAITISRSRSQTRSEPYPVVPGCTPQHAEPSFPAKFSGKMRSSTGGPPKEKRLKKMEQNKTAATRYRQKKKTEQEALSAECDELEQRNHQLAEKADSLAKEIQYLKDLMEEVRQAKSKKAPSDL